jgi:hypothetical protein
VERLVRHIRIIDDVTIITVLGKKQRVTILRVLREIAPENVVAILRALAAVAELTIYQVVAGERRPGYGFHKLPVLREKWLFEIVVPPVTKRIPFIRPITLAAVDGERTAGSVNGDDLLPTQFANTVV